jgi:hypothetical protein
MRRAIFAVLALSLVLAGCSPVERQAYNTIVAAKGFLDSLKAQHTECATATSALCVDLKRATAAKDSLIDAVEVYCSGPQFEKGGPCNAPAKGTPAAQQAADKLRAAIANYEQTEKDLKGVVGK